LVKLGIEKYLRPSHIMIHMVAWIAILMLFLTFHFEKNMITPLFVCGEIQEPYYDRCCLLEHSWQ